MSTAKLPITSLPVWATFNNVKFNDVRVGAIDGKGQGLIAEADISSTEEEASEPRVLVKVPHAVTLCEDVIVAYSKTDKRFYELLELLGPQVNAASLDLQSTRTLN
jgi:hypothetical protein